MNLPAVDCLQRGVRSLLGNWELILFRWLGGLAIGLLVLLGIFLPLLGLGLDLLRGLIADATSGGGLDEWLGTLGSHWPPTLADLALGAGVLLLFWGLAGCAYAFLQAALFGTLQQADEAAAAAGRSDTAAFRVVSWGSRYFGRYFALVNLFGLVLLAGFLPLLLGVAVAASFADRSSGVVLVGVGCLGGLFAFAVSAAATIWYWLAEAELAAPDSSVAEASRRALKLFGRRLGAVLLLVLLAVAAAFALSMLTFPFSTAGSLFLRDDLWNQLIFQLALSLIQGGLAVVPQIALAGALVALARGERDAERPAPLFPSVEVMSL
jgi:hypothetical protein